MHTIRTKEEKIKMINEWNNCCSRKEREEFAKKYGYKNPGSSIMYLKKSINIKVANRNKSEYDTDEKKLAIIKTWEDIVTGKQLFH